MVPLTHDVYCVVGYISVAMLSFRAIWQTGTNQWLIHMLDSHEISLQLNVK